MWCGYHWASHAYQGVFPWIIQSDVTAYPHFLHCSDFVSDLMSVSSNTMSGRFLLIILSLVLDSESSSLMPSTFAASWIFHTDRHVIQFYWLIQDLLQWPCYPLLPYLVRSLIQNFTCYDFLSPSFTFSFANSCGIISSDVWWWTKGGSRGGGGAIAPPPFEKEGVSFNQLWFIIMYWIATLLLAN